MVNDYFEGSIMSVVNADKFAIQHIEPSVLKFDLELMELKFWDYKMMHPTVATMYFYSRYHAIVGEVIEREIGVDEAVKYRRLNARRPFNTNKLQTIRGFWKARQAADGIGCNYDSYIRAIITNFRANQKKFSSFKAGSKNRQEFPYATQMTLQPMIDHALAAWKLEKVKRFPLPQHADIPNNPDLWFRPEMEAWIRDEGDKQQFGGHYVRKAEASGIIMPREPTL